MSSPDEWDREMWRGHQVKFAEHVRCTILLVMPVVVVVLWALLAA